MKLRALICLSLLTACAEGTAGSEPAKSGKVASIGSLRGGSIAEARDAEQGRRAIVRSEDPTISGAYDASQAQKEVRARLGAIKACYQRGLRKNEKLAGRIVLRWTIDPEGTVSGVRVDSDSIGEAEVVGCVKSLVGRWRFPPPPHGAAEAVFPLVFSSGR